MTRDQYSPFQTLGPPSFPRIKKRSKAGEHVFIRLVTSAPRHPFISMETLYDLLGLIYHGVPHFLWRRSALWDDEEETGKRFRQWASNAGLTSPHAAGQTPRFSVRVWLHPHGQESQHVPTGLTPHVYSIGTKSRHEAMIDVAKGISIEEVSPMFCLVVLLMMFSPFIQCP